MQFAVDLRAGVLAGAITCSVRRWSRPKVREQGRYVVGDAVVEVDRLRLVPFSAVTANEVARSGEPDRASLRRRAAHSGPIEDDTLVYVVDFHLVTRPTCRGGQAPA